MLRKTANVFRENKYYVILDRYISKIYMYLRFIYTRKSPIPANIISSEVTLSLSVYPDGYAFMAKPFHRL